MSFDEEHLDDHRECRREIERLQTEKEEVHTHYAAKIVDLRTKNERLRLSEELAWGLIANAYGGDWGQASQDWHDAAERWRDEYRRHLPSASEAVEAPQEPDVQRGGV